MTSNCNYASPTSGDAYRDRRLTTNFELWVEIFCVPTCFHKRIPKPCLSVCLSVRLSVRLSVCPSVRTPRKETTIASSISVLHWQLIHQWKGLHEYYAMETQKLDFFFQKSSKFEFWLLTKSWNHLSFVNISPTLVIDTSMERSLRVLQHGNKKNDFFFSKKFFFLKKVQNSNFDFWRRAEITLASSISVLHE